MKHLKKIFAAAMALFMALAVATPAFAAGNATITITNASKGETYKVSKLFDASVTGTEGGSVRYSGDIPTELEAYFEKDANGVIKVKGTIDFSNENVQKDFRDWANAHVTAEQEGTGATLEFTGLDYGYYIVTTTQGEQAVTVNTTNPNASLVDKNSTTPVIDKELGKQVDDALVTIGQEVTYTVTFQTSNFDGAGEDAKRIVSYTITDTLPDFLSDVTVTSITIDEDPANDANELINVTEQFENKAITLDWANAAHTESLYKNGAIVTITYTAVVNDNIKAGNVANENTVTLSWTNDDGTTGGGPRDEKFVVTENIQTGAAAIQKIDENNKPLAGATFSIKGLVVEPVDGVNGYYTVVSYDKSDSAAEGTTMSADETGLIVIRGIASDEALVASEVDAPAGYNRLTTTTTVNPVMTSQETTATTTVVYYDEDGNVTDTQTETSKTVIQTNEDLTAAAVKIQNNKGAELPETGGIGTTLFYVIGGLMVAGAAIALVVKNRVAKIEK